MARILVVDDDAHTVRVTSLWLSRNGHEVLEASHGAAALDLLDRESVDLIISDMNMPRMDGMTLASAVRRKLGGAVPMLVLSSRCDHAELAERLKSVNVELFPKPFVPSRLLAHVEQLLAPTAPS
jgi:two-component system chemotaxis response regulator CheY